MHALQVVDSLLEIRTAMSASARAVSQLSGPPLSRCRLALHLVQREAEFLRAFDEPQQLHRCGWVARG